MHNTLPPKKVLEKISIRVHATRHSDKISDSNDSDNKSSPYSFRPRNEQPLVA